MTKLLSSQKIINVESEHQRVGVFVDAQNMYHTAKNLYHAKVNFKKILEEAVNAFLGTYGSVHRGAGYRSIRSTDVYERARERIRHFCGASDQNYVVFTVNTTGAINQAAELFRAVPGKVLLSDIEHSSNFKI